MTTTVVLDALSTDTHPAAAPGTRGSCPRGRQWHGCSEVSRAFRLLLISGTANAISGGAKTILACACTSFQPVPRPRKRGCSTMSMASSSAGSLSGSKRSSSSLSSGPRRRRALSDITNGQERVSQGSLEDFDPLNQPEPGQYESQLDLFDEKLPAVPATSAGRASNEDCFRALKFYGQQIEATRDTGELLLSRNEPCAKQQLTSRVLLAAGCCPFAPKVFQNPAFSDPCIFVASVLSQHNSNAVHYSADRFAALTGKISFIESTLVFNGVEEGNPLFASMAQLIKDCRSTITKWAQLSCSMIALQGGLPLIPVDDTPTVKDAMKTFNFVKDMAQLRGYCFGNGYVYAQDIAELPDGRKHVTPHWRRVKRQEQPGEAAFQCCWNTGPLQHA